MVENSNPQFCFAHSCEGKILHCDITNGMKGLHSNSYNEFCTRSLNYNWARGSYLFLKYML